MGVLHDDASDRTHVGDDAATHVGVTAASAQLHEEHVGVVHPVSEACERASYAPFHDGAKLGITT